MNATSRRGAEGSERAAAGGRPVRSCLSVLAGLCLGIALLLAGPTPSGQAKLKKPDLDGRTSLTVLTDSDYPPFHYFDEEGQLVGFNVALIQALCEELGLRCQVAARRWDNLVPALKSGEADVLAASIRVTPQNLKDLDFTNRYYLTPGRFVVRNTSALTEMTPEGLVRKRIGVVAGTAHEAFLNDFFSQSKIVPYKSVEETRRALLTSKVDVLFGDGVGLSFWLNGTASNGCCAFRGGPYTESRYFGEGIGFAVRRKDWKLRDALNSALEEVRNNGRYEELFLRYFPLSFY